VFKLLNKETTTKKTIQMCFLLKAREIMDGEGQELLNEDLISSQGKLYNLHLDPHPLE